jgi:hypothetical protein
MKFKLSESCKLVFILLQLLILFGCQNSNKCDEHKTLNSNSINNFNEIFKDFVLNNRAFIFSEGYVIDNPNYNEVLMQPSDTANMILFTLKNAVDDSLIIAVNKIGCFACLVYDLYGKLYINQSLIFPFDFNFLNQEKPSLNIDCKNNDNQKIREATYDRNMLGKWKLDSLNTVDKNYSNDFQIKSLLITKETLLLNDSINLKYHNSGFDFDIQNSPFSFFKAMVNRRFMILINIYNGSYEEFYFSKEY